MKKWKLGVLILVFIVVCSAPVSADAATLEQREACKQKMMEMLRTAETEPQNISQYRMKGNEIDELFTEIRHGDGAELFGGYYPSTDFSYTIYLFGGYVRSIQLINVNEDALSRYEQMVPVVDSIVAGVEEDMSDLDKIIYLHDTIVDMTDYQVLDSKTIYTASGVFVENKAVCAGYAKALNVLLQRVGIETSYVSSESLNHGWSYVKLDGQWYHVDPTWDDTRTPVAGKVSRANLLRNDEEFSKNHSTWEVKVFDETSVSAKYEDWLVHDIVGEMIFENGRWYCLDTASRTVVAIDAVNNSKEALFDYSYMGSVTLVDVVEDRMILNVNGMESSRTVEEWKVASEEAKDAAQITPDGDAVFSMDFSNLGFWRTGHYDATYGAYSLNRTRICLNDLIENTQDQYVITVGNEEYKIAIREYNARKKIIGSTELGDGEVYVPSDEAVYLGVSLFNSVQSKGITFETYESMFANGFTVGFNLTIEEEPKQETEDIPENSVPEEEIKDEVGKDEEIQEEEVQGSLKGETVQGDAVQGEEKPALLLDFSDITYWRTGHYDATFGAYCLNRTRICLKDLMESLKGQYVVTVGDEEFKVAIREYNARKKIIGSVELGDGDVYVPSEEAVYIGISVFNCVQSKGISFETYEEMFANGFVVGFKPFAEEL